MVFIQALLRGFVATIQGACIKCTSIGLIRLMGNATAAMRAFDREGGGSGALETLLIILCDREFRD